MPQVIIRRCPVCPSIAKHADEVQEALNKEPGVTTWVVNGAKSQFTVEVNGQKVAWNIGELLPTAEEVALSVQNASLAGSVV